MPLDAFLLRYLVTWLALCVLGLVLFVKDVELDWRAYGAFLTVPWKLALFVPAIVFVTFAGRYTNDETWDVVTGAGMSLLTFLTAGWSLGALAKVLRGEQPRPVALVAVVVALFASSWFYDGWLLLRDGLYTARWKGNLLLSPIIYVSAGLLLNLERRGRGLGFAFTRVDWPRPQDAGASLWLALAAVPLVLVAAYVLVAFVGWRSPFR